MTNTDATRWRGSDFEIVEDIALPLRNLEFLIDEYLMANGSRLDIETRFLLAGIRDSLDRVANSAAPGGAAA